MSMPGAAGLALERREPGAKRSGLFHYLGMGGCRLGPKKDGGIDLNAASPCLTR